VNPAITLWLTYLTNPPMRATARVNCTSPLSTVRAMTSWRYNWPCWPAGKPAVRPITWLTTEATSRLWVLTGPTERKRPALNNAPKSDWITSV